MAKNFFILFLFLYQIQAFAEVTLEQVTGQFLNVHGTDWDSLAQNEEDWNEIRFWHEQIIENPKTIEEVYPQPGMVEYLVPIAIHSYGKLIGDQYISQNDQSKQIFNKLTQDITQGKNPYIDATLEALNISNSPWSTAKLRSLVSENDAQLNDKIFKNLSDLTSRFGEPNPLQENLDTDYQVSQVDIRFNSHDWKKEVFEIRKLAKTYFDGHPDLKTSKIFAKLSKNSNQAAEIILKRLDANNAEKSIQTVMINTNIGSKAVSSLGSKPKILARKIASKQNEDSLPFYAWFILFFLLGFIALLLYRFKKVK